MLPKILDRLTPRVYPRTRILTAATVWSVLGIFLIAKGLWFSYNVAYLIIFFAVALGLGLGLAKSRFVFDRVAIKVLTHIGTKPSRSCLGGLFSIRNWALILVMAVFGRAIGGLPIHAALKTGLYVMVGSGLGYSSRLLWRAWRNSPAGAP